MLDVAELVSEIGEAVFLGKLGANLDHARRTVDAPHAIGAVRDELRDEALAGAEVGHRDRGNEPQREMAEGFPGAAGAVVLAELAGNKVEILFGDSAAFKERAIEIGAVVDGLGKFGDGFASGLEQR